MCPALTAPSSLRSDRLLAKPVGRVSGGTRTRARLQMSRWDLIVTRMETTTTTGSVIAVRFVRVTGPGAESESICVGGGKFQARPVLWMHQEIHGGSSD